jgi:hypothetical protein
MNYEEYKKISEDGMVCQVVYGREIYDSLIEPVYNVCNESKADFVAFVQHFGKSGLITLKMHLEQVEYYANKGFCLSRILTFVRN